MWTFKESSKARIIERFGLKKYQEKRYIVGFKSVSDVFQKYFVGSEHYAMKNWFITFIL